MRPNLYRQLRLVVILVSGIGLIAIVGALTVAYWSEVLQREFLDNLTQDEYQELLEHLHEYPDAPLPRSTQLQIWMDGHPASDPVPESLRSLSRGYHHDVSLQGDTYHLYKTSTGSYTTYVAIETSRLSNRERWLQVALVGIAMLDIPLALIMGIWLVRRIALPHEQLAQRVGQLEPGDDPAHISQYFRGQEVARIAEAIDNYQDRLRGFIERERSFTAAASHELRTPLASVLTSAEALHHDPRLDKALRNYTQRLFRGGRQLGELLDGLMWLAREKDEPERNAVNLAEATRELAAQISENGKTIEVIDQRSPEAAQNLQLPAALFDIVVSNLLRNARQFSPPDKTVLAYVLDNGLRIHNQGPVIPKEELGRVFERHYRSRTSTGQGLGLYIAATICKRMHWRLDIHSDAEQGTVVRMTI